MPLGCDSRICRPDHFFARHAERHERLFVRIDRAIGDVGRVIVAMSYTPIEASLRSRPTPQCRFSCSFMIAMRLVSSTGGSVITAQAMNGR